MIGRRALLKALAFSPMAGRLRAVGAVAARSDASPHYRWAFAHLARLTEPEKALIAGWKAVPLDGPVDALLRRARPALDALHRGAGIDHCDWPEIVRAEDLCQGDFDLVNLRTGKLALLRARTFAGVGRGDEALDDVFAAAGFGRHFGLGGIMINRVGQFAMENESIACLGAILPRLDRPALDSIPGRVDRLPPPCSWVETMRREGRFIASTLGGRFEALGLPIDVEDLRGLFGEVEAETIFEATGGDRDRLTALVRDVVPYLEGLAEVFDLPAGSFAAGLEGFKGRAGGINPVAASVVAWADSARFAADRTALLWSLLLAARTRIVEGDQAFREILDPFGDGPFAVEELAGGFEVRSALDREGKPPAVVRVVG